MDRYFKRDFVGEVLDTFPGSTLVDMVSCVAEIRGSRRTMSRGLWRRRDKAQLPAMKVAFRADATRQIGVGHFMRCMTLATKLQQSGAVIRFISRELPEHLRGMLMVKRMEFVSLDPAECVLSIGDSTHAHWLGTGQVQDAQATVRALSDRSWDWLVVDHYALDVRWELLLRGSAERIMVIDDIADRQHDCDVLLDQNFYADMDTRYIGKVPSHCRMFLGPRHALLRDEFRQMRRRLTPRYGPVKRILIFFGGMDADNCTAKAIDGLASIRSDGLHVDVVIGMQHPYRKKIESACTHHGYDCHVETDRMAELMARADLAIGGVGSATWERCSVGLPSIALVLAENQRKAAADLDAAGVLVSLGDARLVTANELGDKVVALMADDVARVALSRASLELMAFPEENSVAKYMVDQNAAN